jgi:hypothetical protein
MHRLPYITDKWVFLTVLYFMFLGNVCSNPIPRLECSVGINLPLRVMRLVALVTLL